MNREMLHYIDTQLQRATGVVQRFMPLIADQLQGARIFTPNDLIVHDNGIQPADGNAQELDYLWWHLTEIEGGKTYTGYRVIKLLHLTSIPLDVRGDTGILAKMREALRGIYNAQVEIVYLAAGIFSPVRLGLVQCYGAVGRGATLDEAIAAAESHTASIRSSMAAVYAQIRLEPIRMDIAEWITAGLKKNMQHAVIAVGQPDPRENARGGFSDVQPGLSSLRNGPQSYASQQNELVMRGMAELEEDFLLMTIISPIGMQDAATMLAGLAEYTSVWASQQSGVRSFSMGLALPMMMSGAVQRSVGQGYTTSEGQSHGQSESFARSQSQTHGAAYSETEGESATAGIARTTSHGLAITKGVSEMQGVSSVQSFTDSHSIAETSGQAISQGQSESSFNSVANSAGEFASGTVGANASVGAPGVASVGGSVSATAGVSSGQTVTSGQSSGSSTTQTESQATTEVHGSSSGQALGTFVSQGQSLAITESVGEAETESYSTTTSHAETRTTSEAESSGTTDAVGQSHAQSAGQSVAHGLSRGLSEGITVGLAPSVSLGDSNAWQYDPAILLTNILRQQQLILDQMTREGGYYVDVYGLTATPLGQKALLALIPTAFHGTEDVITGVQTRTLTEDEEAYIRAHAMAMVPSTREAVIPELMTAYADSTPLTMLQTATYMTPALFEEGTARTVQEAIPPFAFSPAMHGSATIGRMYSTERGALTRSLLRLTPENHFHTAFVGDTGFGKSVTAERTAYETTLHWRYRTIVLDFGQGWRKALNWQGIGARRVDIRQLYPGAVRPMRWNPLQVPRRIEAGKYRTLIAELFANAGRMGPRQLGFMREALTKLYRDLGVLVSDQEVQKTAYGRVRNEEESGAIHTYLLEMGLASQARRTHGMSIRDLTTFERQALTVHRSRQASLSAWVQNLQSLMEEVTRRKDANSRSSLQGVLLRVEPLAEGEMGFMYGAGDDTVAVEDLGLLGPEQDKWGICVIEGGAELDEFTKSAFLSLIASILYLDAIVRRREAIGRPGAFPPMQIFFEEANKVLSGVASDAASDSSGQHANQAAQIFQTMWRDGRKYSIFLHVLAQTVSELPPGILSSCNNGFFCQTKNDRDREAVLAHLARNVKGFVNSEYDRFLARMPIGMAIAKLGYSSQMLDIEPHLVQPLQLTSAEPSDVEIARHFLPVITGLPTQTF